VSEILGDKLNIVYEDTLLEITPELMKKTILKQDKEIEQLKDVIKNKHLKEIERLKNINEEHRILNGKLRKELQQKESIIKEVREYIYNKEINTLHFNSKDFLDTSIATELLEILDKVGDEK